MHEPDDWKAQALEDFRQWLDALGEEAAGSDDPDPADCDLRDLFAELAALRQEVRLQNRELARAGRALASAAERHEATAGRTARGDEALAALEERASRTAEGRCLAATLEVRDALVRGQDTAVRLRDRRRLFRRPPPGAAGVAEGYELAIRRFDRMLSRFDVRRVETVGQPFDGRIMHAVEARRVAGMEDGRVVEELRSGFVRRDDVLRLADVAVNRRQEQE